MKACHWSPVLALVLAAYAQSAERPTISFAASDLSVRESVVEVRYDDFSVVPVVGTLSLPAKSCLVELYGRETVVGVRAFSGPAKRIAEFGPDVLAPDVPTSEAEPVVAPGWLSEAGSVTGTAHVAALGELEVDGRRYADLLVFPVTVDSCGNATFCESLFLYVGSRLVEPDALLDRRNVAASTISRSSRSAALSDTTVPGYVIVTSGALADAFRPLARYRTETGYETQLTLIEDVLATCDGRDDAERLRAYLQAFHESGGRYVLLGGDETVLPIRYAYAFNTYGTPSLHYLQICDLYFADLTGEWDADNDGVWGEPLHDRPDLFPELLVGRLPFNTPEEIENYTRKLIAYEMSPGEGDRDYLARAFFFSSDQMRDYGQAGQHGLIAEAFPDCFLIDTISGVERLSGDDANPTNPPAHDLESVLSEGYGIVNVIAHGGNDAFCVRTSNYNEWPKSLFNNDNVTGLAANGKSSLYYSLACANGGFDKDQPPFLETGPNLVQTFLAAGQAGAVAFVAYSRWGWVNLSHLLHRSFFDSLFAHPECPAVEAVYASKAAHFMYRDLVYGQNFFGDPSLRIYLQVPVTPAVKVTRDSGRMDVAVTCDGIPVDGCRIVLSIEGELIATAMTDMRGRTILDGPADPNTVCKLTAVAPGMTTRQITCAGSLITGSDEDQDAAPQGFSLEQNYPNPFNPATTIAFDLQQPAHVRLDVHNVLGQIVSILKDEVMAAGRHVVPWHGRTSSGNEAASGVYLYRLAVNDRTAVRKMSLLR